MTRPGFNADPYVLIFMHMIGHAQEHSIHTQNTKHALSRGIPLRNCDRICENPTIVHFFEFLFINNLST